MNKYFGDPSGISINHIYFSGNIVPKLSPIEEDHFALKYETFWEEFLFIADHGDIPKVRIKFPTPIFCVSVSRIGLASEPVTSLH